MSIDSDRMDGMGVLMVSKLAFFRYTLVDG